MRWIVVAILLVPLHGWSVKAAADEEVDAGKAAKLEFFESKIRPVLVKHCYQCHSNEVGTAEGSLLLDSRDGVRAGGDRGPAIVPGDPDASLLIRAISHTDSDLKMPPKMDRLGASIIEDFRKWIEMGAADPRDGTTTRRGMDWEAGRRFWAFQVPTAKSLPEIKDRGWPKRDLDWFVLSKLEAAGMTPSVDADHGVLLRRLHFDLVGLPPSIESVKSFKERASAFGLDAALEQEVDSLLASKDFGERWGRHWLDVVRFAESSGKDANISFPYAWRYRDYVIDCLNQDKPFDRFLVEQIAGDLLPYDSAAERVRLLVATGFLAVGPKNLEEGNALQFQADVIDEQIDAVTRAVMGSSVACARCHDHKFDPFSMEDYYGLAGIFASTRTFFGTFVSPANRVGGDPLPLPRIEGEQIFHKGIPAARVDQLKVELAALKKEHEDGMKAVLEAVAAGKDPEGIFTLRDALRIFWRSGAIEGQLEAVDAAGDPLHLAMGVLDGEQIRDVPLLERGEITRPAQVIPRSFPKVISLKDTPVIPNDRSGRLEFAQWLTRPEHPLTSRVMVNRIWRHMFGAGLVRTVDNFGTTGERPTHPELLDHLSNQFSAGGWSNKDMVRELALSRTYRQASTFSERQFQQDPDNRLLWRMKKRRLEAESIRDAMLFVSGELDSCRPRGSLVARQIGDRPISLIGLDKQIPADLDGSLHRSIYLPILRDRLPDILDLFDFAEPSLVTGDRETTNVPLQALYLMNSSFVQARSEAFATRLSEQASSPTDQAAIAFRMCYGRDPDDQEQAAAVRFLEAAGDDQDSRRAVTASFCQALFSTAEFRNID